jgi:hypothetical protein
MMVGCFASLAETLSVSCGVAICAVAILGMQARAATVNRITLNIFCNFISPPDLVTADLRKRGECALGGLLQQCNGGEMEVKRR